MGAEKRYGELENLKTPPPQDSPQGQTLEVENISPAKKLVELFDSLDMPLNETLKNQLNEENVYTRRKGSGLNQAIHSLAKIVNSQRGDIFDYDYIQKLYQEYDDQDLPRPPLKTLLPINEIEKLLPQLEEETKLITRMILDLLSGYTPSERDIVLPAWNNKPDAGWCTTAELYFLEYANNMHSLTRPEASFNTITDVKGDSIMIEKIEAGNRSAITLKETVLNGVRLPAGSLVYIERDKNLKGTFSIKECIGVNFLRCTTLAISPENRERAWGEQIEFQRENHMPAYDTTTIEDLSQDADSFSTW